MPLGTPQTSLSGAPPPLVVRQTGFDRPPDGGLCWERGRLARQSLVRASRPRSQQAASPPTKTSLVEY